MCFVALKGYKIATNFLGLFRALYDNDSYIKPSLSMENTELCGKFFLIVVCGVAWSVCMFVCYIFELCSERAIKWVRT